MSEDHKYTEGGSLLGLLQKTGAQIEQNRNMKEKTDFGVEGKIWFSLDHEEKFGVNYVVLNFKYPPYEGQRLRIDLGNMPEEDFLNLIMMDIKQNDGQNLELIIGSKILEDEFLFDLSKEMVSKEETEAGSVGIQIDLQETSFLGVKHTTATVSIKDEKGEFQKLKSVTLPLMRSDVREKFHNGLSGVYHSMRKQSFDQIKLGVNTYIEAFKQDSSNY